jgi:hypothetical protein
MKRVNGLADVSVVEFDEEIRRHQSPAGKAFLRVIFEDGTEVLVTLTLAEMIGGVAAGTAKRLGYRRE